MNIRHALLSLALAAPVSALAIDTAGFETAAQVEQGLQKIAKDPDAQARYCKVEALLKEQDAAARASDFARSGRLAEEREKLEKTLPAYRGYVGLGMKKAMDMSFWQSADAQKMNATYNELAASCTKK